MSHLRCTFRTLLIMASLLLAAMALSGCASDGSSVSSTESPNSAYTQLGMAYLQRDDFERAQQAFERAIDIAPNDPDALQGLALVYQRQGETASADRYFQRALSTRSTFPQARNNYAAFLFGQNRISEACDQLEQAAGDLRYDRRAQLFANLGQCRQRQNEHEASMNAYQRALQLDDRLPRAWLGLAEMQYQLHQHEAARASLAHYIQLAGQNDESMQLSRQLHGKALHDG